MEEDRYLTRTLERLSDSFTEKYPNLTLAILLISMTTLLHGALLCLE